MSTPWQELDPFVAPQAISISDVPPRGRAAVRGVVMSIICRPCHGGRVLEVEVADPTGAVLLLMTGRRELAGVSVGTELTAAGCFQSRRGQRTLMNPCYWLHAEPPAHGRHRQSPEVAAAGTI